ncbi:YidB family protein [Terriglobus aquaticus]|uniref:YidB family protein n=1 Tax=Terriglobus aquaticus TaxID=940139 RepID=A0ABW9KN88_9BACT|nr:YidB family protein [Terriglobus aquaticus]
MGLMDMVTSMMGNAGGEQGEKATVTGGLMEELQNHPGGVGGVMQSFQQNGLGGLIQQWSNGQTAPAAPSQIEQGLGGTGLIENIAQRTGLSPTVVKMGLAVAVPMLIHHYFSNGHVDQQGQQTGPQPESGGVLQNILGRII